MAKQIAVVGQTVIEGGTVGSLPAFSQSQSLPFSFPAIVSIRRSIDSMSIGSNARGQVIAARRGGKT